MRMLVVKNWQTFQHYKERNPPWIKLHRSLLDDYEFSRLHDASKAQLILIWMLASQNDGRIPEDAKFLQQRLSLDRPPDLEILLNQGFLIPEQDASNMLADSKQDASDVLVLARSREKRREEERRIEAERVALAFENFYTAYPRKVAKSTALRAWQKLCPDTELADLIIAKVLHQTRAPQWLGDGGKFIPHPATYLNQRRWEDVGFSESQERRLAI